MQNSISTKIVYLGLVVLCYVFLQPTQLLASARTFVNDAKDLTPKQSLTVVQSTIGNTLYPIPNTFIEKLGLRYSWMGRQTKTEALSNAGLQSTGGLIGDSLLISYLFSNDLTIGLEFGQGSREFITGITSTQTKISKITSRYTHFIIYKPIFKEKNLKIMGLLGGGPCSGDYYSETVSSTLSTYSRIKYLGSGFSYQGGIEVLYYLNPIWSVGSGVYYFHTKMTPIQSITGTTVNSPTEFDFSGASIKVFSSLNF
tara:strand:- start:294 stop:1061 length:768 start_codon:yes stop_codon:yes gene_type:complete